MLNEEIKLLKFIAGAQFEIGVLEKDEESPIKTFLVFPDGRQQIPAGDAMFFTEYGTAEIPGRFVLERGMFQAGDLLDRRLGTLTEEILEGKHNRASVENYLRETALSIRDFIRDFVRKEGTKQVYFTASIDENPPEAPSVCDFEELSQKIDCLVKFAN